MADPIKIRMTGDSRTKLQSRGVMPCYEDGAENAEEALEALNRQKTNIVIKSESEAAGVLHGVDRMRKRTPQMCVWMTGAHKRAFNRVYSELVSELREREWCGYEPKENTSTEYDCPECDRVGCASGDSVRCMCGNMIEL